MTPRELEEYRALRATIRERGTTRICVFVAGLAAWAALSVATSALSAVPLATLVPLLVLAGVFEAIFALHIGVERIGRYLQVFYESDDVSRQDETVTDENVTPRPRNKWEQTAMAFGRGVGGSGTDPLFVAMFAIATLLNFVPVMLAEPIPAEIAVIGGAHFLLLVRLAIARRAATRQRAIELARFVEMRDRGR
jgi:hypothetical protein